MSVCCHGAIAGSIWAPSPTNVPGVLCVICVIVCGRGFRCLGCGESWGVRGVTANTASPGRGARGSGVDALGAEVVAWWIVQGGYSALFVGIALI